MPICLHTFQACFEGLMVSGCENEFMTHCSVCVCVCEGAHICKRLFRKTEGDTMPRLLLLPAIMQARVLVLNVSTPYGLSLSRFLTM